MSNFYYTPAGAGTKSGADWDNAGDTSAFLDKVLNTAVAGDILYLYSGTYNLPGGTVSGLDGTVSSHIKIIGVSNQSTLEPAQGDDRPYFYDNNASTYSFGVDNFWEIRNIRMYSNSRNGIYADVGSLVYNVDVFHDYAGGNGIAINCYTYCCQCNVTSTQGTEVGISTYYGKVSNCYVKGFDVGIQQSSGAGGILLNIVADCTTAGISILSLTSGTIPTIINNTLYNCGYGINASYSSGSIYGFIIFNNTISNCTTGINIHASWGDGCCLDYNNFYNNVTDVVNGTKGNSSLQVDPDFTDAANYNFSLKATSNLLNAGISVRGGVS